MLATVGSTTFSILALPGNEVVVTLTGVPDCRRATITVNNVKGAAINASVSMGFLLGDVNNTHAMTLIDTDV